MRRLVALLFFTGCVTPASTPDDTPGRNGLALHMEVAAAEEVEDTAEEPVLEVEVLELSVDEVRFTGFLDEQPVETTDGSTVQVELASGGGIADLPTLSLEEGAYTDARYEVRVASLRLEALVEEEPVRVEVNTPITWAAETSEFLLPDGPDPTVTFTLAAYAWLDVIALDEAETDDDGVYVFSSASNTGMYEDLLGEIVDATEGAFPEGLD